jgi:ribose transport system ATP-binding protein
MTTGTLNAGSVLTLEGLSKVFQGQRALDQVGLELRRGEVHALLGQNGSGKSTLIKILSGYHSPEPGAKAMLRGEPLELGSAEAAHAGGLRFIHQDSTLVDGLSVAENLALGGEYTSRWWVSDRREADVAAEQLARYGVVVDPSMPAANLSPAQHTMVAIVRALRDGVAQQGVLVLDEPTATLPGPEAARLFDVIRTIRNHGGTVLYVTHRLQEVFAIADRVSVLRDGRRVATEAVGDLGHDRLVQLIVGRSVDSLYPSPPPLRDDVALEVKGVAGGSVQDLTLTLHRGEIVGLTGLVGSGIEQALHLIFGAQAPDRGQVTLDGVRLGEASPPASIRAGLAFAPADRKRLSGIASWTLAENVTLPRLSSRGPLRWMGVQRERSETTRWLERLNVVPAASDAMFSSLSGGNQQKTVLARWLRCGASVYLLEEPTASVDIGAKGAIYESLAGVAEAGAGVLITSTDVEEVCSICDRVMVMREGRVAAVLHGDDRTEERVLAESMRTSRRERG